DGEPQALTPAGPMRHPSGEMPFLEHLEELRVRILRTLLALVAGFGLGLWLVNRFSLIVAMQAPIVPYLPGGKLTVLSPTDPVMIVLKLAFLVGLVFASPVLLWQLWAFLAPALYEKEKKAIVPALFAGFGLFLAGAGFAWAFVVPKALEVLLTFQADAFAPMITYEAYFGFVMQIVLAMGLSSELPLLMIILAALGLATPATFGRFRRIAVVLSFVAGAFLSPGADIFSMLMMTVPLLLLYEVGIAGAVVIHRRQLRRAAAAAATLLALVLPGAGLQAQMVPLTAPRDTLPQPGQRRADSASAKRLGLPTGPSRQLPAPDSVVAALLELPGYQPTRYLADTAVVFAIDRRLRLAGHAMTERNGTIMEADAIEYQEARGDLIASGEPRLFDKGTVLVGQRIRYDTQAERGVVEEALTQFQEMGANWFVRGNLAADSSSRRLYAASGEITSCDLPTAHYHFATKQVKWMSKSMLVARPAVLYVRDVPIAWIPFMFQETKPGRRSGILVPQFGFNDIVRPSSGYSRQVTDAGYYWAPNDYIDVAARFDWYSGRYFRWSGTAQYKWLDRFLTGSFQYSSQTENTGAVANSIRWGHQQYFGLTTSLAVNLNLTTNSSVISDNALDPLLNTQQLASDINLSRRFSWGQVTLGGRRRQTLGDDQISQSLPSLTITPAPIDISSKLTWSPAFSMTNDLSVSPRRYLVIPQTGGAVDSVEIRPETRLTNMSLETPLRIGSFNWRNSLSLSDGSTTVPDTLTEKIPNEATPDPTDSILVVRGLAGTYESALQWDTGINLPILFRSSWKLTPSIGITNVTGGAFAVRNERTDGQWVFQGKRAAFGLTSAPTFFGFFPGFGPVSRIRHSLSPILSYAYAPSASIPEAYAEAVARPGQGLKLQSDPTQTLSLTLSQNFEAKQRTAGEDTLAAAQARKLRVLGISTSGITYDLEQAKKEGRTGWTMQTVTNTFQSDLLPGFSFAMTHNLWDGPVGQDTSNFDLFLSNMTAGFGLSANTFKAVGRLFGLGGAAPARAGGDSVPSSYVAALAGGMQQRSLRTSNQLGAGSRRGFT
ncbi:MAG: hypothetical protein H6R40_853, partial [Gemmatimonadetes bacterium]|nr:hypothetical protein [Gemmatimonadota bacterium]